MTTEQIAIIVPGTAAVLIAAINAWWQARVSRQTREAERSLAVQGRVASTYEDMLHMVGWQMEVVEATEPIMTIGGEPSLPPTQPDREQRRRRSHERWRGLSKGRGPSEARPSGAAPG